MADAVERDVKGLLASGDEPFAPDSTIFPTDRRH
jgi:hypothetical protein